MPLFMRFFTSQVVQDFFHQISPCSIGKSSSIKGSIFQPAMLAYQSVLCQRMVHWWFGARLFGIRIGVPLTIPFIRGSQESKPPTQTTNLPLADLLVVFLFLSRKSGEIDCSWSQKVGCPTLGCSLNQPDFFCYNFLVWGSLINNKPSLFNVTGRAGHPKFMIYRTWFWYITVGGKPLIDGNQRIVYWKWWQRFFCQ